MIAGLDPPVDLADQETGALAARKRLAHENRLPFGRG